MTLWTLSGDIHIVLADPLRWNEYVWIGIPMLLVFAGGALGGFVGAGSTVINGRIFRSDRSAGAKYGMAAVYDDCRKPDVLRRRRRAAVGDSAEIAMPKNMINAANADACLRDYEKSIVGVGHTIPALRGRDLIIELKRGKTGAGPYPDVSLFEAANRIMTDLVILHCVKWLLTSSGLDFDEYMVEYGHENNNRFDIEASKDGRTLIGEAFNVAPSFFQGKKAAMIKKLKIDEEATVKLILVNHDAVAAGYSPKPPAGMRFVFVNITTGACSMTK